MIKDNPDDLFLNQLPHFTLDSRTLKGYVEGINAIRDYRNALILIHNETMLAENSNQKKLFLGNEMVLMKMLYILNSPSKRSRWKFSDDFNDKIKLMITEKQPIPNQILLKEQNLKTLQNELSSNIQTKNESYELEDDDLDEQIKEDIQAVFKNFDELLIMTNINTEEIDNPFVENILDQYKIEILKKNEMNDLLNPLSYHHHVVVTLIFPKEVLIGDQKVSKTNKVELKILLNVVSTYPAGLLRKNDNGSDYMLVPLFDIFNTSMKNIVDRKKHVSEDKTPFWYKSLRPSNSKSKNKVQNDVNVKVNDWIIKSYVNMYNVVKGCELPSQSYENDLEGQFVSSYNSLAEYVKDPYEVCKRGLDKTDKNMEKLDKIDTEKVYTDKLEKFIEDKDKMLDGVSIKGSNRPSMIKPIEDFAKVMIEPLRMNTMLIYVLLATLLAGRTSFYSDDVVLSFPKAVKWEEIYQSAFVDLFNYNLSPNYPLIWKIPGGMCDKKPFSNIDEKLLGNDFENGQSLIVENILLRDVMLNFQTNESTANLKMYGETLFYQYQNFMTNYETEWNDTIQKFEDYKKEKLKELDLLKSQQQDNEMIEPNIIEDEDVQMEKFKNELTSLKSKIDKLKEEIENIRHLVRFDPISFLVSQQIRWADITQKPNSDSPFWIVNDNSIKFQFESKDGVSFKMNIKPSMISESKVSDHSFLSSSFLNHYQERFSWIFPSMRQRKLNLDSDPAKKDAQVASKMSSDVHLKTEYAKKSLTETNASYSRRLMVF